MKRYQLFFILLLTVLTCYAEIPLVILHTNDTHSQLEPFSSSASKYPAKGGILRREAYCRLVRQSEPNVLVFESGDFVQGTSYFNFFKGRAEVTLLNYIKPTAITLGNHEFDSGVDFLVSLLKMMKFPVVCTNYDVSGTKLEKYLKPWLIVHSGGLEIGIISANINPGGSISPKNFAGIKWVDPIDKATETALWLRTERKCDVVICLSHLGYTRPAGVADDVKLATRSKGIDVILGGHSHTFMKEPVLVTNLEGKPVIINQVGKSGVFEGRLDLLIEKRK